MRWPFRSNRKLADKGGKVTPHPEQDMSIDVGPRLLDYVFAQMQIDAPWSLRDARAFTWWGHRLAQRVWVDQPRESRGVNVVRAVAETELLNDVPRDQKVLDLL